MNRSASETWRLPPTQPQASTTPRDAERPPMAWAALLVSVAITLGTGALGAIASAEAPEFYARLDQPDWFPPAGVFGPVWTILYLLMAVAAWRVWRLRPASGLRGAPAQALRWALGLYGAQLVLNALWSFLFFRWHMGLLALADVALMLGVLGATTVAFWRLDRLAGLLMTPTLAWVGFAGLLNAVALARNPLLLG